MMPEWRTVFGWPMYDISDEGDVFSRHTKNLLKLNPVGQVCLSGGSSSIKRSVSPGVLVLEAFVGPCPEGMECCHYDDCRSNNALSNVRWDIHKGNMKDRDRNGKTAHLHGESNGHAVLTSDNVLEAIALRKSDPKFWSYRRLGERYGVTYRAVSYAVNGQNWAHLKQHEGMRE